MASYLSSIAGTNLPLFGYCIELRGHTRWALSGMSFICHWGVTYAYWPSVRSIWLDIGQIYFALLWRDTKSRLIKTKKEKKTVQYPAILTKQAWSINNILYDQKETFSLAGPMREIPSGKDRPFLPAQVANQNTGFASDSAIQLINKTSCKFPRYCNTPARLLILFSSWHGLRQKFLK